MPKKLSLLARLNPRNWSLKANRILPPEDAHVQKFLEESGTSAWQYSPYDMYLDRVPGSGYGFTASPYTSWATRQWGVVQNQDFVKYETLYSTVPAVRRALDMRLSMAVGKGYRIITDDDAERRVCEYVCRKHLDADRIRIMGLDVLKFANSMTEICYAEELKGERENWPDAFDHTQTIPKVTALTGLGQIVGLKPLDPIYMRVNRDAWGNVYGYSQWLSHPPVYFTSEKVCHIRMSPTSRAYDSAYGVSILRPVPRTQELIWQFENDMAGIIHSYVKPMLHHQIGTPDEPFDKPMFDSYKSAALNRKPVSDVFTWRNVDIKPITQPIQHEAAMAWLAYLVEQRTIALGVPPEIVGQKIMGSYAKQAASWSEFVVETMLLQEALASTIEDALLKRVIDATFPDRDKELEYPKLEFLQIVEEDKKPTHDILCDYFDRGLISKEAFGERVGIGPEEMPASAPLAVPPSGSPVAETARYLETELATGRCSTMYQLMLQKVRRVRPYRLNR